MGQPKTNVFIVVICTIYQLVYWLFIPVKNIIDLIEYFYEKVGYQYFMIRKINQDTCKVKNINKFFNRTSDFYLLNLTAFFFFWTYDECL